MYLQTRSKLTGTDSSAKFSIRVSITT